jgi:hypothetical protein
MLHNATMIPFWHASLRASSSTRNSVKPALLGMLLSSYVFVGECLENHCSIMNLMKVGEKTSAHPQHVQKEAMLGKKGSYRFVM